MLKNLVLFSLALFIISCGSDSPTNSVEDTFDIGITENKEWVYESSRGSERKEEINWIAKSDIAPDGVSCFKIISFREGESPEDAEAKGSYNYFNGKDNSFSIFRSYFISLYYNPPEQKESYWEDIVSLDKDSWIVYKEDRDSTFDSGLYIRYFVEVTAEIVDKSTLDFKGEKRKTVTSRTTYKTIRTTKPKSEPEYENIEISTLESTIMDGIGVYELKTNAQYEGPDGVHEEEEQVFKLVDYKEK